MISFGLDYLSAHLARKGYDLSAFEQEASSPTANRETGEVTGATIPRKQYRKDIHYGDVVIGAYSGGQYGFAPIVNREGLKVTRVDIRCDISTWEGIEDGRTATNYASYIYRLVRNYLLSKGRRVRSNQGDTVSNNPNEPITYTLGARESEWQLRIYAKDTSGERVVRFEWQLRKDLARQCWAHISPAIDDQQLLMQAFQAIESEVLSANILQIKWGSNDFRVSRGTNKGANAREQWIRTQVLSACLSEFRESGINLPELLLADFNRHFTAIRNEAIQSEKLTKRLKAARLFSDD